MSINGITSYGRWRSIDISDHFHGRTEKDWCWGISPSADIPTIEKIDPETLDFDITKKSSLRGVSTKRYQVGRLLQGWGVHPAGSLAIVTRTTIQSAGPNSGYWAIWLQYPDTERPRSWISHIMERPPGTDGRPKFREWSTRERPITFDPAAELAMLQDDGEPLDPIFYRLQYKWRGHEQWALAMVTEQEDGKFCYHIMAMYDPR